MLRFTNKFLSLLFVSSVAAAAHEQMLLVIAQNMDASTASLQRYAYHNGFWDKAGNAVAVNVGRNGLGWGNGVIPIAHPEADPVKREGDGRAPAGIFQLGPVFGDAARAQTAMPYLQTTDDLICIDDSRSKAYNRIVPINASLQFGSFEWMHRRDGLYRLGVVVQYNIDAEPGHGSCIFLHIERARGSGTAGCTSMNAAALKQIVQWLDPRKKPLLVQIPAQSLPAVRERFKLR